MLQRKQLESRKNWTRPTSRPMQMSLFFSTFFAIKSEWSYLLLLQPVFILGLITGVKNSKMRLVLIIGTFSASFMVVMFNVSNEFRTLISFFHSIIRLKPTIKVVYVKFPFLSTSFRKSTSFHVDIALHSSTFASRFGFVLVVLLLKSQACQSLSLHPWIP